MLLGSISECRNLNGVLAALADNSVQRDKRKLGQPLKLGRLLRSAEGNGALESAL